MILKRSLFRKALVFIVIFAVAATGIVLATTAPAGSRSVGVLKSADQNSNINNDVTHASSVPNTPDNTAPKTNTVNAAPNTNAANTASSSVLAATAPAGSHGVGVLKSADPIGYVNYNVTYRINVFNPSDFNLSKINVTDTMLKFNTTIPFMAAGNKTGVTYVMNRTVLANDTNPLINTVSVEAIDSEGVRSTATTQAKTTIMQRFLEIKKSGPARAHELDPIKYTIVVKNVWNATLSNVTVADKMLGFSWLGDLSVNETNVFNLTYVVPKNSSSPLMNTATATTMVNESKIYAEASWAVNILHPRLLVNKTVTPEKVCQTGGNVTYKIVVTNVGDAALSNITLVDSFFGAAPAKLIPQNLLPGQSVVWSFNATLKKGATSIATATGVDALGRTVSASCKVLTCFETDDQGDCHHENCSYECKED